jgi:hypothetical protein
MISKRYRALFVAALALVGLATMLPAPAVAGGPISEMIGRYKMHRQTKIPPMEKPFTGKPVKDISPSSLSSRFKKRFSMTKPSGTSITSGGGLFSPKTDSGLTRTSR